MSRCSRSYHPPSFLPCSSPLRLLILYIPLYPLYILYTQPTWRKVVPFSVTPPFNPPLLSFSSSTLFFGIHLLFQYIPFALRLTVLSFFEITHLIPSHFYPTMKKKFWKFFSVRSDTFSFDLRNLEEIFRLFFPRKVFP